MLTAYAITLCKRFTGWAAIYIIKKLINVSILSTKHSFRLVHILCPPSVVRLRTFKPFLWLARVAKAASATLLPRYPNVNTEETYYRQTHLLLCRALGHLPAAWLTKPYLPFVRVLSDLVDPEVWQVSLEVVGQQLSFGIVRAVRLTCEHSDTTTNGRFPDT